MEAHTTGLEVRNPISFSTTIIANLARDRHRGARRRLLDCSVSEREARLVSSAPTPDEQISTRESLTRALDVLERLPLKQRLALLLRSQGDDYSCIARAVGTTEQNARKLVQVARARVQASE